MQQLQKARPAGRHRNDSSHASAHDSTRAGGLALACAMNGPPDACASLNQAASMLATQGSWKRKSAYQSKVAHVHDTC